MWCTGFSQVPTIDSFVMSASAKPTISTAAVPLRVLVVEDEPAIRDIVATALRHHGHSIAECSDGLTGLDQARGGEFDLIVLDVMLPGIDGHEVCRQLRLAGVATPVLFLSARDAESDRIKGFVSGADDYLTKPFSIEELSLRVAAILRRSTGVAAVNDPVVVGDLSLDPIGREVRIAGELVDLSPTEFRLLHYFMTNQGIVLSKSQILMNVWDDDFDGSENVVELYVGYLRRKIDDRMTRLIHTQRGVGYVMREPTA